MLDRFVFGALGGGPFACQLEILDGLAFVMCAAVVVREFGRHFICLLAITNLLTRSDPLVKLDPVTGWEQPIQHFLIQSMQESETARDGTVRPFDWSLHGDKLFASREVCSARFDFSLGPLERCRCCGC